MGEMSEEHHHQVGADGQQESTTATCLPEELMSSVLVFLRMKELLEWRLVANSTKSMWATENHVSHVARRLAADLHHCRDKLKAITLLAPSPYFGGTEPVANRDLPLSKWKKCLNIGHKGAHGHVKGNTMASFVAAVKMGVDVIEFDVLTTQDGVVMCHHDPLIEETGEWIENLTLKQTRSKLGDDVPTFEEMLQDKTLSESSVHLYIDMKHTEIVRPVLHMVKQAVDRWGWAADRIVIATFRQLDLLQVNAYRQAFPELAQVRTACIMDGGPLTLARDFKALKVDILSTGKDHVSPDLVADCQRRSIQVWVWTVNSIHFMERLVKMGVDGICTDYPELVHDANKKYRPQARQSLNDKSRNATPSKYPFTANAGSEEPSRDQIDVELQRCLTNPLKVLSSQSSLPAVVNDAADVEDVYGSIRAPSACESYAKNALGGWFERPSPCRSGHKKVAEGECGATSACYSDQQRLLIALYGDIGSVRDFSVGAVQEAKLFLNACSCATSVKAFLSDQTMVSKAAVWDVRGVATLCKEAESEAEQALRPLVSSAETFQWSVDLISTEQGRTFMAKLQRSMEHDERQPMLSFERAFMNDLLGMVAY